MSYLSQGFWKAVEALKNGGWARYSSNQAGSYLHNSSVETNCLCALGVINSNCDKEIVYLGEVVLNKTNIPNRILEAAEMLYEGWDKPLFGLSGGRTSAALVRERWTHKEVGEWLEKVGKGIERKQGRACEFNCEPYFTTFRLRESAKKPSILHELAYGIDYESL